MKKFIITAMLAIASVTASAQMFVGGSVGFWHDGSVNSNEFTILPEVGFNFSDHWTFGTQIGYTYRHENQTSTNLFRLSPYARYTFYRTDNNLLSLFVDGGVGIGVGEGFIWNVGLKPGVALNITKKFSVVAHLGLVGYNGANDKAKRAGYKDEGGFLFSGENLSLGFYYNF